MSGIFKSIGRALKKVWKSPIFKAIIIAAAIYFTAGVGLAAMGSTFAAALPGITAVGQAVGLAGVGAIAAEGAAVAAAVTTAATAAIEVGGTMGGMGLEAGIGSAAAATGSSTVAAAAGVTTSASSAAWGGISSAGKDILLKGVVDAGMNLLKETGDGGSGKNPPQDRLPTSLAPPAPATMPKLEPFSPAATRSGTVAGAPGGIVTDYLQPTAPVRSTVAQEGAGLSDSNVTGARLTQGAAPAGNSTARTPPPLSMTKSRFSTGG